MCCMSMGLAGFVMATTKQPRLADVCLTVRTLFPVIGHHEHSPENVTGKLLYHRSGNCSCVGCGCHGGVPYRSCDM